MRLLLLLAAIFPLLITANIWDNLFLGQGVSFRLPQDFIMVLQVQQDFGRATFKLTGSSSLNCLSITQGVELDAAPLANIFTSDLLTYRLNFTAGTLYAHSLLKDCIAVQDNKFETEFFKSVQEFIDIGTLLVSREEEDGFYKLEAKKLIEMINVKKIKEFNLKDLPLDQIPVKELPVDKIDLEKLDPSNLAENYAEKIPELVLYFDKQNHNLKKMQLSLSPEDKYSLDVIEIKPYQPQSKDFTIPQSWNCHKQQAKPLHELDVQEILKEVQENGGKTFNLISPFLPEGWVIPDLNKLMNQFKDLLGAKNKQ